jgi:hypothetical protein
VRISGILIIGDWFRPRDRHSSGVRQRMKSLRYNVLDVAFHMIGNRAFANFGSYFPSVAVVRGRVREVLMFERVAAGLLGAAHSFCNNEPNKTRQINRAIW